MPSEEVVNTFWLVMSAPMSLLSGRPRDRRFGVVHQEGATLVNLVARMASK